MRRKGQYAESVPPLKRAIERDSEFALAYEQLGISYRDLRNLALGNRYLERAYELRNWVSERERLTISATFFRHITGELDKRIETSMLLTQTYPQDPSGYHLHGNSLMIAGEYEQAAEAYRAALSEARGLPGEKVRILGNEANLNAIFGLTQLAEKQTALVLTQLEKEGTVAEELLPAPMQYLDSQPLAWTLALCGAAARAQTMSESCARSDDGQPQAILFKGLRGRAVNEHVAEPRVRRG